MYLITWSKRAPKFIISINLGKFELNTMYKYHVLVQVWFESEFYKSLTMNYHLKWGANLVIFSFCGTTLLDQSHSNPDVTWGNDCLISHYCAIFHENCAISQSLFLLQKLISRKFHFQKKWFIISLCSLLFVLCLSKSRDLTNTKYGSREITRNNGTKCALHYQSLSLSLFH